MEEDRVQRHVPRLATRRCSEEDLQEALKRSHLETDRAQEKKSRRESKDKVSGPSGVLLLTVEKPPEVAKSPTPSRTTIEDPARTQEEQTNHATSSHRRMPQRPRRVKEGKPPEALSRRLSGK